MKMGKNWLRNILVATVTLIGMMVPAYAAEPTTPLTIHLVSGNPIVEIIGMMQAKKDMLPNYGKAYTIDWRRVDPCSQAATLLASGAADIAASCTGALINTNTKLHADIRVVADVAQNGVEGQNAIWYCVRADSPIKTIKDLKGKTVATSGYGSWVDVSMRVGMKKAGLDPSETTVVQLPFSAMDSSSPRKEDRHDGGNSTIFSDRHGQG